VFLAFILTCGLLDSAEGNSDEIIYTDVEYSPDGKSITIYLDGSAPVRSDRALTKSLAILAHDFFEVAFMYRTTATDFIIARGSWELGQSAGVTGVHRPQSGADYGAPIANDILPATGNTLAQGTGTAILFAGKRTDRTLLAVGELCAVDGNTSLRSIGPGTTSVSFELNALKAGTSTVPAITSFWTNPGSTVYPVDHTTTAVTEFSFKYRPFPLFGFGKGTNNRAVYNLDVHSSQNGVSFNTTYRPGIIVAAGAVCTNVEPHYTVPYGTPGSTTAMVYKMNPLAVPPDKYSWWEPVASPVTLGNNTTAGRMFDNGVQFAINTVGADDLDLISITFEIPVYPLSLDGLIVDPTATPPVDNRWWIRPGYDEYLNELDNGKGGNGGAILIGIGNLNLFLGYRLKITNPALKIQYNGITNYNFDYTGLDTILEASDGFSHGQRTADQLTYNAYAYDEDGNEIHLGTLNQGVPLPFIPYDGRVRVELSYFDAGLNATAYGEYWIIVSSLSINFSDIPYENRFVITTQFDWNAVNARITAGGYYLIVLSVSTNIPQLSINPAGGPLTLVITANRPGVILGRGENNDSGTLLPNNRVTIWQNGTTFLYLGQWPFNEPIFIGGDLLTDYPYNIHSGGRWENYPINSSTLTMFFNGNGTGTINHFVGPGVNLSSTALLR
jgi:hypothetical protein